jgi:predicted amidophosphoribosyltransferase
MFRSLVPLLFPLRCLSCKEYVDPEMSLCSICSLSWSTKVKRRTLDNTPFFYSCSYNSVTSRVILKAKEEGNLRARSALAQRIAGAITDTSSLLLPIPSRSSANRIRGYRHATLLAEEAIAQAGGIREQVIDALYVTGATRDQSGLKSRERQENLHQKFAVDSRRLARLEPRPVFIVDDLVTSGASAREAIRALQAVNIRVAGLISACAVSPN